MRSAHEDFFNVGNTASGLGDAWPVFLESSALLPCQNPSDQNPRVHGVTLPDRNRDPWHMLAESLGEDGLSVLDATSDCSRATPKLRMDEEADRARGLYGVFADDDWKAMFLGSNMQSTRGD